MQFYMLGIILYFLYKIIVGKDKFFIVLLGSAYFVGVEVFLRMTKAIFFYETSKYMIILFSTLGMFYLSFRKSAYPYIFYILLLVPGILVSYDVISYDADFRTSVLFNLSGPIALGVVSIFCYGRNIRFEKFLKILDYIVYPLITTSVYVFLYSPSLSEPVTGTASDSAFSGGYGPNQVATVLGLGVFILLSRLFIPYKNLLVQWIMMFFMILMAYRALLTFSRGGVISAIAMSLIFILVLYFNTNLKSKIKLSFKLIGIVLITLAIWFFTIFQTGGLIGGRYANEDSLGREKGDITTGRVELFTSEINAFKENPFFGLGVGQVKTYFNQKLGTEMATHNEISRLLSEHGMFGVFSLLILIFTPIISRINGRKNIYFYPFFIFWALTISHSSMRIAAPAFIYALGILNIKYDAKKKIVIHRK